MKIKKVKKIPRKRPPRGKFYCSTCEDPSAVKISCGFCKLNSGGERVVHTLCSDCSRGGCPIAYPKGKLIEVPPEYLADAGERED